MKGKVFGLINNLSKLQSIVWLWFILGKRRESPILLTYGNIFSFFTLSHLLINHKINKSRGMFLVCSTIFTNHTRFILGTSNIVVDIVESHFSLIDSVWLSSLQSHSSPRFNLDDLLYDHFSHLTLCFSPWSLWSSSFLPHLTRGSQKQTQLLTVFDSPVSLTSPPVLI